MKLRIYLGIVVTAALVAGFGLGYWSGCTHAGKPTIIAGRDAADHPARGSAKARYEPYFTRDNPIPAQVHGH